MIRYTPKDEVDFVIVGSGGAGGIIAKELSTAGFSVVVLEQGPWLDQKHTRHDEYATQILYTTWNDFFRHPQNFQKTADDTPVRSSEFVGLYYGRHVGGSNSHFTANYWRMHENDFRERTLYGAARRACRLADQLRRPRAVLHEGGMGAWRLRQCPVRSIRRARSRIRSRRCRPSPAESFSRAAPGSSASIRSGPRWRSSRGRTTGDRPASTAASASATSASTRPSHRPSRR